MRLAPPGFGTPTRFEENSGKGGGVSAQSGDDHSKHAAAAADIKRLMCLGLLFGASLDAFCQIPRPKASVANFIVHTLEMVAPNTGECRANRTTENKKYCLKTVI
ncbi:MAG: hypothetical protein AAGM21_14350 [Pseudomonadota bacterium]